MHRLWLTYLWCERVRSQELYKKYIQSTKPGEENEIIIANRERGASESANKLFWLMRAGALAAGDSFVRTRPYQSSDYFPVNTDKDWFGLHCHQRYGKRVCWGLICSVYPQASFLIVSLKFQNVMKLGHSLLKLTIKYFHYCKWTNKYQQTEEQDLIFLNDKIFVQCNFWSQLSFKAHWWRLQPTTEASGAGKLYFLPDVSITYIS
jgi:hypothetical protein